MKTKILLTCFLFVPFLLRSQSGDCNHAIALNDKRDYKIANVSGPGNVQDLNYEENDSLWAAYREHHSTWYTFTAPYDAVLTFHIIPGDIRDDCNFILFKVAEGPSCELIAKKQIFPVRSNLAKNDVDKNGVTGLTGMATHEHVGTGSNTNYSKSVQARHGQRFLLLVDNKSGGKGHELKLNFDKASPSALKKKTDTGTGKSPFRDVVEWVNIKSEEPETNFNFEFYDAESKRPLACNIKLVFEKRGFGEDSVVHHNSRSNIKTSVEGSRNFSLNASKNGYMFHSENYRSYRMDTAVTDSFFLPRAEAGKMISLRDINFQENTTHLLTNSINALQQIYDFMMSNPNAVIEIRGHVNAPGYENSGKVKNFSKKRAEEVKNFLIGMGIEKKRMKTVGLGNEFMIYPSPVNYQQEKANRRVEIMILEN